ncbi:peptidylprolyl isomerase [Undibacterium sp. BYS50W]|nr:peptidylprolyl isomerase [Undibacterium rugosum]
MRQLLHMKQRTLVTLLAVSTGLLANPGAWAQTTQLKPTTTLPVVSNKPRPVNSIIAVVNDEIITRQELDERISVVEKRLKAQGTPLPSREELQKQLLERMILDRAQLQLAKENGMRADDLMLDRTLQRMAEQNKMSLQEMRNQIEREGTPFARFREEMRDDIMMQRIRDREVDSKIIITETEIDNFLAAEASAKAGKQEINLAHILVRIPENASAEQITLRRNRAEEVLEKLRGGADFAKMAVTYSDSAEALKGGEIGWREQERIPQLFLDAVAQVKTGEFSGIIRSANGFHILKLVGKRAGNDPKAGTEIVQQNRVRHILMKPSQIVPEAEVRQKLTELKRKIAAKEISFEDAAKNYSADSTAAKGGDIGWINPGDVAAFDEVIAKLAIGQVSDVIQSQFGLHLIEVTERKSEDQSKDRKRMAAREALRERKSDEALQDWLRELRDRTYVELRTEEK